jgi:hypothetical protein
VRAIFGALIDEKLKSYAETVQFLVKENDRKAAEIKKKKTERGVNSSNIENRRAGNLLPKGKSYNNWITVCQCRGRCNYADRQQRFRYTERGECSVN